MIVQIYLSCLFICIVAKKLNVIFSLDQRATDLFRYGFIGYSGSVGCAEDVSTLSK